MSLFKESNGLFAAAAELFANSLFISGSGLFAGVVVPPEDVFVTTDGGDYVTTDSGDYIVL